MSSISFNTYDHNFCESTIYSNTQHPEYLNSISSLFISFIGYIGLNNPYNNFHTRMIYSSLFLNGITSCYYHYYNTIGWGLLDRLSMILIAMFSVYNCTINIQPILILEFYTNNNTHITNQNTIQTTNQTTNQIKYKNKDIDTIITIIDILVLIYFTILFTITSLHFESLFNILYGLFLTSLVIYIYKVDKHSIALKIPREIVSFAWTGIKCILLSGIFWIVTEKFCSQLFIFKYLFGHVWWHIFVSYGGYLLTLIPTYISVNNIIKNNKQIIIKYKYRIPYIDTITCMIEEE
jgi:hypothetical protein